MVTILVSKEKFKIDKCLITQCETKKSLGIRNLKEFFCILFFVLSCGDFCTFNIRQGNKEICFHFNSESCSQAIIIFYANYLKYKQNFYVIVSNM